MKRENNGVLLLTVMLGLSVIVLNPAFCEEVISSESEQEIATVEDAKSAKVSLEKVEELIKQKKFDEALVLLNSFIDSKPKKYQGYKLRGEVYYALRQYQLAVDDFQHAVDIKREDDKFITGTKVLSAVVLGADKQDQYQNPELGALYANLMYAQKAINDDMYEVSYKKALEYNSHMYLPTPNKADITKINCPQKYGKTFNPTGVDADIASVIEDIEKGAFVEAVYKLPKITSEYPDFYLGYYLTGVVMFGMEHYNEAVDAFNKAIALNPNDFESYASLGKLYYSQAEKYFDTKLSKKSVKAFKKALEFNPNCNTYHYYIGLNALLLGDYDTSVNHFKNAIVIKNNDYNSKYYKAVAQYLQKDYEASIDEATGLLYRRVSNYNSVLYLRALSNYKLKRYESAISDIEKIHHNMDDIYNLDIKKLSPKEKTLECYLYYLQSRIARDNGLGAKSDLEKAYKNPIIALLDTRSADYEYSNYKLTASDIDKQYDYLRTTFDDLGVSFVYQAPDYKIVKNPNAPVVQIPQTQPKVEKVEEVAFVSKTVEPIVPSDEITAPLQSLGVNDATSFGVPTKVVGENGVNDATSLGVPTKVVDEKGVNDDTNSTASTQNVAEVVGNEVTIPEVKPEIKVSEIAPIVKHVEKPVQEKFVDELEKAETTIAQANPTEDVKSEVETIKELSSNNKETKEEVSPNVSEEEGMPTSLGNSPETIQVEKIVNQIIDMKNIPDKEYVFVFDEDTLVLDNDEEEKKSATVAEYIAKTESANHIVNPTNTEIPLVAQREIENVIPEKVAVAEEKVEEVVKTVENPQTQVFKPTEEIVTDVDKVKQEILSQIEDDLNALQNIVNQNSQQAVATQQVPVSSVDLLKEEVSQEVKEQTQPVIQKAEATLSDVQKVEEGTVAQIVETAPQTVEALEGLKSAKNVVNEKHAIVNYDEFDVKNKRVPQINDDDEVVFLSTDSFIKKAERKINDDLKNISLTPTSSSETLHNPLNKKFEGNKNVEVNITPEGDNLASLVPKDRENNGISLVDGQGQNSGESLQNSVAKVISEPQLVEPEEVIIPESVKHSVKKVQEISKEVQQNAVESVNEITAHAVPDYIQPDESVEVPASEDVQKPAKSKKTKKIKNNDNLLLAVGGNPQEYVLAEPKQPKLKEKKVKEKKEKVHEIVEEISTVEETPQVIENIQPVQEDKTKVKEVSQKLKKSKKVKQVEEKLQVEDFSLEQIAKEKVESLEVVDTPVANEEFQSQVIEKPKKDSFFKRLFSKKKVKPQKNLTEKTSETEEEKE